MMTEQNNPNREKIRELVKRINESWLKGRPQELKAFFHPDIRFVGPGFTLLGEGRQACIDSYVEFTSQAVIHNFTESDFDIQVWGNTALASYRFIIEYEMAGETHRDEGTDLFAFTQKDKFWLAVWRYMPGR